MSLTLLETAKLRRRTALLKVKSEDTLLSFRRFRSSANETKPVFRSVRSFPLAAA
jgi:hypothetical protein